MPSVDKSHVSVVGLQSVLEKDVFMRVLTILGATFENGKLFLKNECSPKVQTNSDTVEVYDNTTIVLNKLSAVGFEVITSSSYGEFKVIWTLGREK